MKLTIERAALLKSLNHVQSVVERRNTIPILSNVLLEAADGKLSLTATDMDIAVVEKVDAEIETAGATTAPAHTLYDIVRKLPDGAQVNLDATGEGQLVLQAGRSRFTLQTLATDDFPVMTGGDMPHEFTLTSSEAKLLIDRTRFAISTEETRYYLNGIYMHVNADASPAVLRAVATDGHRLARVEIAAPDGASGMPGVIVPRKTVQELRKLIDETDSEIQVALSETKVRYSFGNIILTSKLIDGTFPDYERVIPSNNDKLMQADVKSFAEAVDRVSTISTEKGRLIKISIAPGSMTLSASSQDHGTAREEVAIDYSAETIEIGFNSRYLLDIASLIESGSAEFVMADPSSPTIVRDAEDASALYVLMPMRV
ncbi:DNA polymerase III subunit beta [Aestuariispira insulae]|uniref:Beta sliding clamp n=1 Tax=Aestuariispira insulae TaxID=1461337 RepID=A0A3D9H9Q1_9PROT|nr:DNA polymerase III subunit beta [Aestuariispira insulae]RED46230.1 DNA polymerase III beta subunit [Aestuariispira insulae]